MSTFTLRIEPPAGPASTHTCESGPLTLGRSPDADIVCTDTAMSRRHARLDLEGDMLFVEDLGARNGTFVNGQRIQARVPVRDGDVIALGATLVRVSKAAPTTKTAGVLGVGDLGSSIFRSVADITADESPDLQAGGAAPGRVAARLKAINDFHRALAGAISLDALLQLLFDRLFAVLHPEEGVILLRQPDGQLTTAASRRLPGATGDLLVSQRLIEEVMGKGTAALVTDVAFDERFAAAESVMGAGIRSILAAPFTDSDGCLGMVAIYSRTTVRRFGEEDLALLVSLASAAALRIRNVELSEAAAARRVHDRELALAHDIQMGMLPRQMPARPEVQMAASLIPARAVGGDLYDFLVSGDSLWFIVADAAGKGVSAALFMAVTRTLFRAVAHGATTVASAVSRMNAELARDNERQFFVTALVGRLALDSGALTLCNAGHPPVLRATKGRAIEALASDTDIALGILEDVPYRETHVTLSAGDVILLVTDGVTEAIDGTGELFSDGRLLEAFRRTASRSAAELVDTIVDDVRTFAAGTPQEDDITVLALRYAPVD